MAAKQGVLGGFKKVNQALFPQFESLKQGRLAKVVNLYTDYKTAFIDTFKYVKKKPFKVGFLVSLISGGCYANHVNPDSVSYTESLLDSSNSHCLISDLIRNKQSSKAVTDLMTYYAQDRLMHVSLGVCSLIMLRPSSAQCDLYENQCKEIQSRWIKIEDWESRILDVGFNNSWYYLQQYMIDYDINDTEFV